VSPLSLFGDRKSKSRLRRETLAENRAKGRAAESLVTLRKEIW
jgi:septum formation topological specificity factor MinE